MKSDPIRVFLYILSFIPIMSFPGINNIIGESAFQAWLILSVGIMSFILVYENNMSLDKFTVCFSFYQIEVFIITTKTTGFRPGILITVLSVILMVMLLQIDCKNIVVAVSIISFCVLIINFISMLVVGTGGFNKTYFIGGKNKLTAFLLPGIFILYLNAIEKYEIIDGREILKYGKFKMKIFYFYFALSVISVIYSGTGTGIIVSIISIFAITFVNKIKINKSYVIIAIGFFYFVIFNSSIVFNSRWWIELLEVLGKDPTLTNRTDVWSGALKIYKKNSIFGVGRVFSIPYIDRTGGMRKVSEAHNILLQVLCDGGLVGTVLYGTSLYSVFKNIDIENLEQKLLFVSIIILLFNGLSEAINYQFMYILIPALANSYYYNSSDKYC